MLLETLLPADVYIKMALEGESHYPIDRYIMYFCSLWYAYGHYPRRPMHPHLLHPIPPPLETLIVSALD
jgi:hypothetical protein